MSVKYITHPSRLSGGINFFTFYAPATYCVSVAGLPRGLGAHNPLEEPYMPEVAVILGSDSDLPKIKECFELLEEFGVSFEICVSSAHRSPERTRKWALSLRGRGVRVVIAAAGGAAHLPGVVAAHTTLPVIGVPIESRIAGGLDSLLSIAQMPAGVPVGAMGVGKSSGANAALYAIAILASHVKAYAAKLESYRKKIEKGVAAKNQRLQKIGHRDYIAALEKKR